MLEPSMLFADSLHRWSAICSSDAELSFAGADCDSTARRI